MKTLRFFFLKTVMVAGTIIIAAFAGLSLGVLGLLIIQLVKELTR